MELPRPPDRLLKTAARMCGVATSYLDYNNKRTRTDGEYPDWRRRFAQPVGAWAMNDNSKNDHFNRAIALLNGHRGS